MPYEEDQLTSLDHGDEQAKADDAARHARYAAEDAETAAKRAHDDVLAQGGIVAREARRAQLQLDIQARDSGQPVSVDQVAEMKAQIAKLEAQIMARPVVAPVEPVVTPPAAPTP